MSEHGSADGGCALPPNPDAGGCPVRPERQGRRSFLRGVLGASAVGAAVGVADMAWPAHAATGSAMAEPAVAGPADPQGRLPAVPFEGIYQAGILPPPQRQTMALAFDVTAGSRGELADLFQTLTQRARFLTAGGLPTPEGATATPSDSGILGPTVVPDGLTVTVGVGASLFDERFGLASSRPAQLTAMIPFPNDNLDAAQCGGDLSVQLSAGSADTVLHALRDITRHTRGGMQIRWRIDGFASPPRPSGTPRNLMGFKDGIANPDTANPVEMSQLVWVQAGTSGEPAWTVNGSYLAIRLIRMFVEFWDRVSITEQENMIGRARDTGAPLDANSEFATPDYANDPDGAVIPLDAHIRLANPRTPQTTANQILRRAYNYDRGVDAVGNLDQGLIFTCYQQDLGRQFKVVQTRLIDEPLVDYISPFGGGYFFALPGIRNGSDYYGRALLS
jgi:deferrochelatase/peroxidase EfeB